MNILVTGDKGFIGSYLIPKLKELGHKVSGMDIKSFGDIRSREQCKSFTKGIDCVVHLAALTDVQESIKWFEYGNFNYHQTNITGTLNMLNACVLNGVKRFVFASSAAAEIPESPYGAQKACGEIYSRVFRNCYGLSTINLAFFNIYGKGTEKGAIPKWINKIKNGEMPEVYGGDQTRDFIYVKDVVDAIVCAINSEVNGTYDIGTGRDIQVRRLVYYLVDTMKSNVKVRIKDPNKGEIQESKANTDRAWLDLGFQAKYTLGQGIAEMLE